MDNMKNLKGLVALVVAMMMVVGMMSMASAATIQITHDASYEGGTGTTARVYNAYKVFDASYTSLSGENTQNAKDTFTYTPDGAPVSYSMALNSPWKSLFIDSNGAAVATQTWFNVNLAADGSKYIVTPKDTYTTAEQAKAFGDYLAASIPTTATATEVTVDGSATTVDGNGYYLIVAKDAKDAVTRVAVVTTDTKLVEKNTYITTTKTASETSYNVGDIVTYTATVTIPSDTALTETDGSGYKAGHGPVVLHDKMDSQLTFNGVTTISAQMDSAAFTAFTSALGNSAVDSCTFEITIPVTSAVLGKTITFTYTATVNDTAATNTGYVNELFGELNGYKTNPDDVKVYTFDFTFKKDFVGVDNNSLTATFELRTTANDSTTAIKFNALASGVQEKSDDATGSATLTIHDGESINLVGLEAGTYYLVETGTSTGYNLLDGPVEVVITDTTDKTAANWTPSHTVSATGGTMTNGVIVIENKSGTVLPSTGGIGTTLFYIAGVVMVLGAAAIMVARRKSEQE